MIRQLMEVEKGGKKVGKHLPGILVPDKRGRPLI
jgi:hypothetical protein